jgi:threonine dehydratase
MTQSTTQSLTPSAIHAAYGLIQQHVHRTPLLTSQTLNSIASTPQPVESLANTPFEGQTPARPNLHFFFKCENYQRIGAFKARGAFHALLRLIEAQGEEEVKRRGVITHSSGTPPANSCRA